MAKQYGSSENTKLDYRKMARDYSMDFLNLQRDYLTLKQALKQEQEENGRLREEAERLRATITSQNNRISIYEYKKFDLGEA